jgi:hemolysin activation/secretion protein
MLRLNQNPDLEVTAVLSPGLKPATTDIALKVVDSIPYHGGASFDNQGTRLVGKNRTSYSFRSTNLSGFNDSFAANTMTSASSSGQFASYSVPIGTYGARAGFDFTYFEMKLGEEFKDFDITGKTEICSLHVSDELYLSGDAQAYAELGLDIKSIKRRSATDVVTNDQLRLPYIAFDLAKVDTFLGGGQTVFVPRLTFSTENFLGASSRNHPSASRDGTGGFFFKYEQTLRRIQRMPLASYVSVRSQFQAASHTLPSSEQLQLGGANSVRGYPEGEYLADIGTVLNVEWVFPSYIFPKEYKLPHARMALRDQLQPVIFIDLGAGALKKVNVGERRDKFLIGVGGGLRFQFSKNFFLRLDWAKRVGNKPTLGQGPSTLHIACQLEI